MAYLPHIRHSLLIVPVIAVACLFAACGDDDDNGSNPQPDPFADIAETLTTAGEDFLNANANISASVQAMEPHIAAVLGLAAQQKSAAGEISCLPEAIRSRIYKFNGTSYVADADTILDETITARFILYQLSIEGEPVLELPIGSVELTCVQQIVYQTEIRIYSGSIGIASMALNPATNHFTGKFRTPDGARYIHILGNLLLEGELSLNFLFGIDDMQATYEFPLDGSGTRMAHVAIVGPYPEPDWGFFVDLTVDGSENIESGYALYRAEPDLFAKQASCINTGTLDAPGFAIPTTECYEGAPEPMAVKVSQLQSMSESYQATRSFWLAGSGLVEACLAILAVSGT